MPASSSSNTRCTSEARRRLSLAVSRQSHCFHARVADQFDHIIHFDETRAVEPLEKGTGWNEVTEFPETYPVAV